MMKTKLLLTLLLLWLGLGSSAQMLVEPEADELLPRVSLLTIGPGCDVYQLEGHSALRLRYPGAEQSTYGDIAVNWGVFDFNTPNFIYRFCKGETMYSIGLSTMDDLLWYYAHENRDLDEQELDLSPAQIRHLIRAINVNLRPENREYRYNYVKDNCSTRPLALIEDALGSDGSSLVVNMPQTDATFRSEMRYYHRNHPTYQFGIDLALGSGIDYNITPREQAFAPVFLERLVASAEIQSADSSRRPLARQCVSLLKSSAPEPSEGGPSPWVWAMAVCLLAVVFSIRDLHRKKTTRLFDFLFYMIYGILGIVIAFLVFVSTHEATSPNLNILWLNPLLLVVPMMIWIKKCQKIVYWFQICNFALVLAYLVIITFANQSFNWMFLPLILADMARSATYSIIHRHDP